VPQNGNGVTKLSGNLTRSIIPQDYLLCALRDFTLTYLLTELSLPENLPIVQPLRNFPTF
jgi:hypothetical protein